MSDKHTYMNPGCEDPSCACHRPPIPLNVIAAAHRAIAEHAIANRDRPHPVFAMVALPPDAVVATSKQVSAFQELAASEVESFFEKAHAELNAALAGREIAEANAELERKLAAIAEANERIAAALGVMSKPSIRIENVNLIDEPGRVTMLNTPPGPPPSAPTDPLDVEYDGVKLRELLEVDEWQRAERGGTPPLWFMINGGFTPVQRAAISAHWSSELRLKVAAAAERERASVLVDMEVE